MKRFLVMLALITVIVGVLTYFMPRGLQHYVEDIAADATVSIYCRSTDWHSNDEKHQNIDLGCGKIAQCSVSELKNALAHCQNIDGFSVRFDGTEQDIERLVNLFNLQVSSTLNLVDGLLVLCGNSAKLTGGVIIDGCVVNMQIAYKDGIVTVGSPLILGDY